MTTLREAAQQALEALEWYAECSVVIEPAAAAITALRAALAEPAWCEIHQHHKWCEHNGGKLGPTGWEKP